MTQNIGPTLPRSEPLNTSSTQKQLVRPENVEGDLLVSKTADGKLSVFLVVWIAFYRSLECQQNQAQSQQQQMEQIQSVQNSLIQQLQGINYEMIPESEINNKNNAGFITNVNCQNQRIAAQINVLQDQTGQVQQLAQVFSGQASTSIQTASQTMNEDFSIAQLIMEITSDVEGR